MSIVLKKSNRKKEKRKNLLKVTYTAGIPQIMDPLFQINTLSNIHISGDLYFKSKEENR